MVYCIPALWVRVTWAPRFQLVFVLGREDGRYKVRRGRLSRPFRLERIFRVKLPWGAWVFFFTEMPKMRDCLCAIYNHLCTQINVLCNNLLVLSLCLQAV